MSRLTRDGTAVSRDQILRRERRQGDIHFPCSADDEQDWQPYYPVDSSLAIYVMTIHIYIQEYCYYMSNDVHNITVSDTFWIMIYIYICSRLVEWFFSPLLTLQSTLPQQFTPLLVVSRKVVFTLKSRLTSIQYHLLFLTLQGNETNFRGHKLTQNKVQKK